MAIETSDSVSGPSSNSDQLQAAPEPLRVSGLPDCDARREFDSANGKFFCAHPLVHIAGDIVTSFICSICSRWQEPQPREYRAFPSASGIKPKSCQYLGNQIGWQECPSCRGSVKLKVFACHHPDHESTTLDRCTLCRDFKIPEKMDLAQPPVIQGGE
jgi:hypothetical protein